MSVSLEKQLTDAVMACQKDIQLSDSQAKSIVHDFVPVWAENGMAPSDVEGAVRDITTCNDDGNAVVFRLPDNILSILNRDYLDAVPFMYDDNFLTVSTRNQRLCNVPALWLLVAEKNYEGEWVSCLSMDDNEECGFLGSFADILMQIFESKSIGSSTRVEFKFSALNDKFFVRLENRSASYFRSSLVYDDDVFGDENKYVEFEMVFCGADKEDVVVNAGFMEEDFSSVDELLDFYNSARFWGDEEAVEKFFLKANLEGAEVFRSPDDPSRLSAIFLYNIKQEEDSGEFSVRWYAAYRNGDTDGGRRLQSISNAFRFARVVGSGIVDDNGAAPGSLDSY